MTKIHLGRQHGYAGLTFPYSLPVSDLSNHALVLGKTGMGKSTLLESILTNLSEKGCGCGFLDPHGDSAIDILSKVPKARRDDVVYLDLSNPNFVPALNVVASQGSQELKAKRAASLLAAFRHLWSDSWGPRLEFLLYNALRILLDAENTSLVSLPRLFTDQAYRSSLLRQSKDPFVRHFWVREYESWDIRYQREAIAPVLNKLGQFVSVPQLRNIFGQVRMAVDFREIMDSRKIIIINLSKGRMGDDASRMAGALLISHLASLAMERSTMPAELRSPFTLVVDEAQNFLTESLNSILSESRKYGFSMVLSNQHLHQLPDSIRTSVLGNVGTMISYRVSAQDADVLAKEYGNFFPPQQFVELPPYTALIRPLSSDSYPFRLSVAEPSSFVRQKSRPLIKRCQDQYTTPASIVEEKLARWNGGLR